jgi:histidyl-tRNA synthetase
MKINQLAKGCRIISGEEAFIRREVLKQCIRAAELASFEEVVLPCLEPSDIYTDRAGPEILGQMYTFKDRSDRSLCLRPEGTATCQMIAQSTTRKDIKVYYEARCWRYERPQAGRYREFTQFGVEWLNPRNVETAAEWVQNLAKYLILDLVPDAQWSAGVKRGLAYYSAEGFEAMCPRLGAQKQILGGGPYAEGIGFAIGIDRVVIAKMGETAHGPVS